MQLNRQETFQFSFIARNLLRLYRLVFFLYSNTSFLDQKLHLIYHLSLDNLSICPSLRSMLDMCTTRGATPPSRSMSLPRLVYTVPLSLQELLLVSSDPSIRSIEVCAAYLLSPTGLGQHEACELRDGDKSKWLGKGTLEKKKKDFFFLSPPLGNRYTRSFSNNIFNNQQVS